MAINRREVLRAFAGFPFLGLSLRHPKLLAPASGMGPCNCISVVLHGFFFLEFQGPVLLAAAPKIDGHRYYFKDHGQRPHPLLGIVNLLELANSGSPATGFPPEMLQFSKATITQNGPFISGKAVQECSLVLILRAPDTIQPLRSGSYSDFQPDPGSVVGQSIGNSRVKGHDSVPLVTCLQYDSSKNPNPPFAARNFYAEHPARLVPLSEVNDTFDEAAYSFPNFDLSLSGLPGNVVPCDQSYSSELDVSDEDALPDLLNHVSCAPKKTDPAQQVKASVEVGTCPQFGVNP